MGGEKRNQAVIELIKTLPENGKKRLGFYSDFRPDAFNRETMLEIFAGGDPDDLYEEFIQNGANDHWEKRNNEMVKKIESATMLLHFAKDLKSEAAEKAELLMKEGVEIARAIGIKVSDRKLEVMLTEPNDAYRLKGPCQSEVENNRDDYVTVDFRVRGNTDRPDTEYGSRLEVYGNEEELMKMAAFLMGETEGFSCKIGDIQPSAPRVPGFIDGDSYRKREVIRDEMKTKKDSAPAPSM